MPPKNYYKIEKDAFLFKRKEAPEEYVRQWVLFELIGTYGYSINQIKIEVSVKYGTKTGFADIIIYKENIPFIVIECKRREEKQTDKHLKQAKSYAAATEIKAEFAVYTNGDKWLVQRFINNEWCNCIDIPNLRTFNQGLEIVHLIDEFDKIYPLLYWLHRRIPQVETDLFLSVMHNFFISKSIFCDGTDNDLLHGLEYLFRPKWHEKIDGYSIEKLSIAFGYFMTYLEKKGENVTDIKAIFTNQKEYSNTDIKDMLMIPNFHFQSLMESSKNISSLDLAIIRLIIASINHIWCQVAKTGKCIELDDTVTSELFNYLEVALKFNLNLELPDKLHKTTLDELYQTCESNWLNHKKKV